MAVDFSGVTCIDHFTASELADYEDWRRSTFAMQRRPAGCPSCGSPSPAKHPKREDGVHLCADAFHEKITPDNTAEDVTWLRETLARFRAEAEARQDLPGDVP